MKSALEVMEITNPVSWHTLPAQLGTLMKANGEDVKTIQELLRHANFKVTKEVYTQAVTQNARHTPSSAADCWREEKSNEEE